MEASVGNALYLLTVGMLTVFFILTMVVVSGRLLIAFVNRFMPETKEVNRSQPEAINDNTMRIIEAAVSKLTNSKGIIEKVEKHS